MPLFSSPRCSTDREPAVADDFSRDPLRQRGIHAGGVQDGNIGMGVDVDEARAHEPAGGIYLVARGYSRKVADGRDSPISDPNIAVR
jgi:hypothetical protein